MCGATLTPVSRWCFSHERRLSTCGNAGSTRSQLGSLRAVRYRQEKRENRQARCVYPLLRLLPFDLSTSRVPPRLCPARPALRSRAHRRGDEKIATVGLYGAKKVIAFTKAVLKGRKEAPKDAADESSAVAATTDDDEDQGGDEKAAQLQVRPTDGMGWGRGVAWRFCPALHETGGVDTLHARIPSGHDGNDEVLHLRGCCFHCCEDRGRVKLVLFCTARIRSWTYFWVLGVLTREVAFRRRIRIARYPNWSACFHPHTRGRPLASFGVVGAGWVQSTWLRLRWVRGCGVRVDCSWKRVGLLTWRSVFCLP